MILNKIRYEENLDGDATKPTKYTEDQIAKDSTRMNAKQWLFVMINMMFVVIGIALMTIGYLLQQKEEDDQFQMLFDECFIAFGLILTLMGTCGISAGINKNPILLRCFLTMMMILLLMQLSVVIYFVLATTSATVGALVWKNLGEGLRDEIQVKLRCCGFEDHEEYEGDALPLSCYDPETSEIWSDPCNKALWEYIARDQLDMFFLVIVIAGLQVLQIGISMSLISDTVKHNEDLSRLPILVQ